MLRGFYVVALLVLCAAPALADDPKKDADMGDKKPEGEKLVTVGQIAGVLTSTGGSEAEYTIRVTLHIPEPNLQAQADLVRKQQQLALRQLQIMSNRNPVQRQQQLVQLVLDAQQMPQNLWTLKEVKQDVKAVPADDMKVRIARPPDAYDDKGNPKKYTAKELKELKGPDNLPGYTGALEDVKVNQLVLVTLVRKPAKAAEKPKEGDKAHDKDKDKDKPLDKDKDNPLLIRTIVVLGEKK
jgi:hypothetical protein